MSLLSELQKEIKTAGDPEKGIFLQRFFKTGKGDYAEGDVFLGITVPQSRKLARKYKELPLEDLEKLLSSKIHEERLIALFILVLRFQTGDDKLRQKIYELYLSNTRYVNNWDLVDSSADKIVGEYLLVKNRDILVTLAKSESLWERRIAIIATFQFIKNKEYKDTLKIAEILLSDKHDLIHKASGWMLREVGGKVSQEKEEEFLKKHHKIMPRTMLRYAIEKFSEDKRKQYLRKS